MQEVNVRIWENAECALNYGTLNRKVTDTMLCAGERGRDACQGDSGGPLNNNNNNNNNDNVNNFNIANNNNANNNQNTLSVRKKREESSAGRSIAAVQT